MICNTDTISTVEIMWIVSNICQNSIVVFTNTGWQRDNGVFLMALEPHEGHVHVPHGESQTDQTFCHPSEITHSKKFPIQIKCVCVWGGGGRHHYHHQSLNREGRWGTTDDFLKPVFSIFPCSPMPSGTCRTPGLSIPWCCLPTSSFVRLFFFPLSLCLAIWFWPDLMNGKHDHATAVCVSLRSSGDLHVVQLPAGSWHGLPRW